MSGCLLCLFGVSGAVGCSTPTTATDADGGHDASAIDASAIDVGRVIDVGGRDAGTDASSLDDASSNDAATRDVGVDAALTPATELSPCASDAACASPLVCRAVFHDGPTRCTRHCASDGDCMTGTRCTSAAGEQVCLASDVGRACTSAADCHALCLTRVASPYCTATCATGSDCPAGYGCTAVGTPATRVCVAVERACSSGDASECIDSRECDVSPGLLVSGCTIACASASDCPRRASGLAPWTCDGSAQCRRPPDVFGPLGQGADAQYACNATSAVVTICNDGHAAFDPFTIPSPPSVSCASSTTTSGVAGDRCVDSCRYQGGCADGFTCAAFGAPHGNCLPVGSSEVGASCTVDSQCRFGLCISGACSRDCTADGVCPSGSACMAHGGGTIEGQPHRVCL